MFKQLVVACVVAGMSAQGSTADAAPLLVGAFSLSSVATDSGAAPVVPIGAGGTVLGDLSGATALDFTTTGIATPGLSGLFRVDSASGDFSALYGLTGTILDFTFSGAPASGLYPAAPLVDFQSVTSPVFVNFLPAFSLDLLTVGPQTQTASSLFLGGTGLFHMTGFADTPGSFVFGINTATNTFSYSSSESTTAIPEAGSLLMLGATLLGLAGAKRRRPRRA